MRFFFFLFFFFGFSDLFLFPFYSFTVDRAKFGSRLLGLRNVLCEMNHYITTLAFYFFVIFFINGFRIIINVGLPLILTYIATFIQPYEYRIYTTWLCSLFSSNCHSTNGPFPFF